MSDLTDMIDDEGDEKAPPPEGTTRPAPPTPDAPTPDAPTPDASAEKGDGAPVAAPEKHEAKRLPRGLVKPPGGASTEGAKGKTPKGKPAPPPLAHDKARRFARIMGKMLNKALDGAAEKAGSPVRASITDPRDPNNGLVTTIEFPDAKPSGAKGLDKPKSDGEELAEAFGELLVDRSPGEALAYHAGRCVPTLAALDEELRKRPWLTLVLVTGATVLQFGLRVVATVPEGVAAPDGATEDPNIGVRRG